MPYRDLPVDLPLHPAKVWDMRHGLSRFTCLNLLAAVSTLGAASAWAAAPEGSAMSTAAIVLRVSGQVRATTDGKKWQMLKAGDAVKSGMLIQTAKKKSTLDLELGEPGFKVKLSENSVLGIKNLSVKGPGADATRDVELDLRMGQLVGRIPSSLTRLEYELQFPSGLVGTRGDLGSQQGTLYALTSAGALAVATGKMVVSLTKGGEPQVVAAGQQFDPANGHVTELPKAALDRMLEDAREE